MAKSNLRMLAFTFKKTNLDGFGLANEILALINFNAGPNYPWSNYYERIEICILYRNVQRFRGGLVFKACRFVYHSTLSLRVIKKKNRDLNSISFWKSTPMMFGFTYLPRFREPRERERERERESARERARDRER